MDESERRAILDEARATLERRADVEREIAEWRASRQEPSAFVDFQPAPEPPEPRRQTMAEWNQQAAEGWERWLHGHQQRDWEFRVEIIGEVIAQERADRRDGLAKLKAGFELQIAVLRNEIVALRAIAAGSVVNLPKNSNAAA